MDNWKFGSSKLRDTFFKTSIFENLIQAYKEGTNSSTVLNKYTLPTSVINIELMWLQLDANLQPFRSYTNTQSFNQTYTAN